MSARHRLGFWLAQHVVTPLVRILYRSLEFEVDGAQFLERAFQPGNPVIFILWHGRMLPLLYRFRDRGVVILVSEHKDGEYLARVATALGYESIRGSSTRGGSRALRHLLEAVQAGRSLAITPDGPQGPRERIKPGALQVARLAGVPVIPVAAGSSDAWWIEGWDRFLIPKPFSTIRIAVGAPRDVSGDITRAGLESVARDLEGVLSELHSRVDPQ